MSLGSYIFRKQCEKSDRKRDAGLTTPADIERFDDIAYKDGGKWGLLDVYRPREAGEKLPVIVSFHGGGWIYGDKEVYQYFCMDLARRGFAVVNYNYRLAPQNKFPCPIEDTNDVFRWLMRNADKYGMDTDNIFAVGDSAGAMGIALYACLLTNPSYAAEFSFAPPEGLALKGLGLCCGVYTSDSFGPRSDFLPRGELEKAKALMNVTDHITDGFPPCYVMTSTGDFLIKQPDILNPVLAAHGIKYESKIYGGEEDKPGHVFHCDIRSETGRQANDDICGFFRSLM